MFFMQQVSSHRSELGNFKKLFVGTYFPVNKFGRGGGLCTSGYQKFRIYILASYKRFCFSLMTTSFCLLLFFWVLLLFSLFFSLIKASFSVIEYCYEVPIRNIVLLILNLNYSPYAPYCWSCFEIQLFKGGIDFWK